MGRLRLAVLAAVAATALAESPHADAPKQELTPIDVVETVLWHICNSTDAEETAAVGRAFGFVMAGAGDTADELKSAATFQTALNFTDVLAHTEHAAVEVSRDDKGVCVRSDLKTTHGQSSAITWCLQKQPESFEACPSCWMIHDFERTPSAQPPSGTAGPHTDDDEGFALPEGRLHLQAGAEAEDNSPSGGMSDEFKLGLGIVFGFLTLIAVVVGALLTKLIRQGRAAENPDVLKLQHNSIMFSPSKLTGEDWKVPITGSVFGFSPLGKTPSPLGKATDSESPSPEAEGDLPDKTSPLAKTMLTLNSPEQGKARGPSPDTPASASDTPTRRRWFPGSPWAL